MLPTQGSTQVYSPFGSYVVEQHGDDLELCRNAKPGKTARRAPTRLPQFEGA